MRDKRPLALGIDFGGVLIIRGTYGIKTSLRTGNYQIARKMPEAFESIRRLMEGKFGKRGYIISRCGKGAEQEILDWLEHHNFFETTGISRSHVYFCRERHEKAAICEKLGITHMIDDRLEVLSYLTTVRVRYLFQGRAEENLGYEKHLKKVRQVSSWREIVYRELK